SRTLLMFHIAANVLGIGLFLIAGAAGSVYLVQERRLRTKKRVAAAMGSHLPPLDALDTTTHRLLLAGFPLLTFGVVTGAVFSHQLTNLSGAESLRSLLGYATWLLLAAVLVLRKTAGFSGRKAAYGTIAGVVCMLLVLLMYVVRSSSGGNL
ncbi:MAG TPA: cytochrome c biogenesis protein CcsA, partial [Polyangiaceae bacterium]